MTSPQVLERFSPRLPIHRAICMTALFANGMKLLICRYAITSVYISLESIALDEYDRLPALFTKIRRLKNWTR
jgi:hypothetical protein